MFFYMVSAIVRQTVDLLWVILNWKKKNAFRRIKISDFSIGNYLWICIENFLWFSIGNFLWFSIGNFLQFSIGNFIWFWKRISNIEENAFRLNQNIIKKCISMVAKYYKKCISIESKYHKNAFRCSTHLPSEQWSEFSKKRTIWQIGRFFD